MNDFRFKILCVFICTAKAYQFYRYCVFSRVFAFTIFFSLSVIRLNKFDNFLIEMLLCTYLIEMNVIESSRRINNKYELRNFSKIAQTHWYSWLSRSLEWVSYKSIEHQGQTWVVFWFRLIPISVYTQINSSFWLIFRMHNRLQ